MPHLDPMSLSTMAGMMAMVIGVLLIILRRHYPSRLPGLLHWGAGLLMFTGGTTLYLLNHLLDLGLTTLPGNAMVLSGFALLLMGSQRFVGQRVTWMRWMLLCAASVLLNAWFMFVAPDYRVRISVFTWTLAFMAVAHLVLLLRHCRSWASRYTAGVLFCASLVMAARGLLTWWMDTPDMQIPGVPLAGCLSGQFWVFGVDARCGRALHGHRAHPGRIRTHRVARRPDADADSAQLDECGARGVERAGSNVRGRLHARR